MYPNEDDLILSSLITVFIAVIVFIGSIQIFRSLFPHTDLSEKNCLYHTWVEKPSFISNVRILPLNFSHNVYNSFVLGSTSV